MSKVWIGVGLRPAHYSTIEDRMADSSRPIGPSWFEVISENYIDTEGRPLAVLEKIRARFPVALHGVSLSIGSTDPLDLNYLSRLKRLADRIDPLLVSDHLCWTGAHGRNLHDLLPLPYTTECLTHISDRVSKVQEVLKRPLVLENVSTYLRFRENEWTEWGFLRELINKSGIQLLLDVNNIYVNSVNHGFDPYEYLDAIPMASVAQIHLAGFSDQGDFLFDTHSMPVHEPVWRLFEHTIAKKPDIPVLIEWDEDIPSFERLEAEAERAAEIARAVLKPRLFGGPS